MEKIAIYLLIEGKDNVGHTYQWYNESNTTISYEEEALKFIQAWRKNGGKYANIDIHCICPTKAKISNKTRDALKSLDVHYVHLYFKQTEFYKCSWFNVPMVGAWLESTYGSKYDKLVHLDLDMTLLREPQDVMFDIEDGCIAKVAKYDDDNVADKRHIVEEEEFAFNSVTCYTVSKPADKFFNTWWTTLQLEAAKYLNKFPNFAEDKDQWRDYCDLEEHAVDVMYFKDNHAIDWVDGFMVGPGYTDTSKLDTIEAVEKIHFVHAHEFQDPAKYLGLYAKAKNNLMACV